MKILVTGATGFIGDAVIKELLKGQSDIIATSKNKQKAINKEWYKDVTYIEYNLNKTKENLFDFFSKPDIVLNLAWDGLSNYNDKIHIEQNLINHYNFLENMLDNGLKNLVSIGTCFEYGKISGCLKEDTITNPNTLYGLAKDSLRKMLELLQEKNEFTFKWIRLFYMHGEGQSKKSLLSLLDEAIDKKQKVFNMSKGDQLRDYLPIDILAKNIVLIILQNNINGIINCGKGKPISIIDLVRNHILINNKNIELNLGYYPYTKHEPMEFWADVEKLTKIKNTNE